MQSPIGLKHNENDAYGATVGFSDTFASPRGVTVAAADCTPVYVYVRDNHLRASFLATQS